MRRVVTKWRATIAALLLLAGCGAVGLWFEFVSVPAPLADLILDRVQARSGLVLSAEQIQAGFLRGLVCRNASVEARTEELSFQGRAAELVIRLRPAGLLREGPAVSRVTFIDACATVQASPGDARNTPLLTVEDADGIVDVASGGLIGRRVAARINGIRLDLRGPLPSLASLMPPAPRKGDQPPAAAPWDRRASQLLTRLCQWLPCPSSEPLPDKGTLFVEFRETTPDLAARLGFTSGPGLRIPPMHLSLDLSLDGRDWSAENLRLVLPGRGEFTGHATVAWPGAAGEEARVTIRGGAAPGTFESCLGLTPPDGTPGSTCAFQIEAEQAVADHAAWTIQAGLPKSRPPCRDRPWWSNTSQSTESPAVSWRGTEASLSRPGAESPDWISTPAYAVPSTCRRSSLNGESRRRQGAGSRPWISQGVFGDGTCSYRPNSGGLSLTRI
jgi:hypothetical protein